MNIDVLYTSTQHGIKCVYESIIDIYCWYLCFCLFLFLWSRVSDRRCSSAPPCPKRSRTLPKVLWSNPSPSTWAELELPAWTSFRYSLCLQEGTNYKACINMKLQWSGTGLMPGFAALNVCSVMTGWRTWQTKLVVLIKWIVIAVAVFQHCILLSCIFLPQEVEYVKEEAKMVYLLECLQKTPPPVCIINCLTHFILPCCLMSTPFIFLCCIWNKVDSVILSLKEWMTVLMQLCRCPLAEDKRLLCFIFCTWGVNICWEESGRGCHSWVSPPQRCGGSGNPWRQRWNTV